MRNLLNSSWNTLFYASDGISFLNLRFENDVNMYGIQTFPYGFDDKQGFENDVNMYGIQTRPPQEALNLLFENDVNMYGIQTQSRKQFSGIEFENDVNMYGIQTDLGLYWLGCSLRMM